MPIGKVLLIGPSNESNDTGKHTTLRPLNEDLKYDFRLLC